MFRRTKVCSGLTLAFGGSLLVCSLPTVAQQQLERVEITGSAIKRLDAETAVPVTVLKMDDLKKEGIVSIEQVIQRLSSSTSTQSTAQVVGSGTGGASFADLRGIGSNKTLLLLNGRRIANNALDGASADLNMIPFAALERIEVLRDGASALYGTDAIGGVINFITRRSYTGGEISVNASSTDKGGGETAGFNGSFGFGDLDTKGFNFLGVVDYQKIDRINSQQRKFGARGYLPERGIDGTSGTTFPANYSQNQGTQTVPDVKTSNPVRGACAPIGAGGSINTGSATSCRFDPTPYQDLTPESERAAFFGKASLKLGSDTVASAEYFITRNAVRTSIGPVPQTGNTMRSTSPFFPGNGITPAPTNFTIDPNLPISVNWRSVDAGPREGEGINTSQRLVLGLEGLLAGWDYKVGLNYNENTLKDNLTGGYSNDSLIKAGIANGIINPFGAQTAAGKAYIQAAALRGRLQTASGKVLSVDARGSRELGDWFNAGAPAAVAVGAEFRKEKFFDDINGAVAGQAASTGLDPAATTFADRKVSAVYGELSIPLLKSLEASVALRHDRYSDFGSTTNPKFSVRYQPIPQFLTRATYSTGFRAPSLYELYNPKFLTFTANQYNDPVLCPDGAGGTNTPGTIEGRDCGQQFLRQGGGNTQLQPEKAKNFTLGFGFEPAKNLSFSVDLWWIKLTNSITQLPENLIFGDPVKYAARYNRDPVTGSLDPDAGGFVADANENLGEVHTNGVDLSANYRFPLAGGNVSFDLTGTYINKYKYQREIGGEFIDNVNTFVDGANIFKWKHSLTVGYSTSLWAVGVTNRYATGYEDENIQVDTPYFNHVSAYSVYDVFGSVSPDKNVTIAGGIRNVLDKDPPFSNQSGTFQAGYDPRYTDAAGRTFWVRMNYTF